MISERIQDVRYLGAVVNFWNLDSFNGVVCELWEPVIVRTVKDVFPGDRREDDFVILVCDRLRRLSFDGGHDVSCLVDQLWVDRRKWPENV